MEKEKTYKAGVLIIGSLFWDNTNGRRPWRELFFGENFHQHAVKVPVPIRYGRYSTSRECPTMILSSSYHKEGKLGQGIFLPFQNQKQKVEDIICSAKALSEAEGNANNRFIKGGREKWCVITYLSNPALAEAKQITNFSEKFQAQYDPALASIQDQFKCNCESQAVFNEIGSLVIDWPENLNDFDLILATQTKPTDCFSPASMAASFFKKPEYFLKNRLNQIYTVDDDLILSELKKLVVKDKKAFEKNAQSNDCSDLEISNFISEHLKVD